MQLERNSKKKVKNYINSDFDKIVDNFKKYNVDMHMLYNILNGKVAGENIVHNWLVDGSVIPYYGKIEKFKSEKRKKCKSLSYVICYWGSDQSYEANGEDCHVVLEEIAADFLTNDLYFI